MTTIVFRDGVLAFDSQITLGDTHVGKDIKAIKTKKYIAAAAGDCEGCQMFMDWIQSGGNPDDKENFGLKDTTVDIIAITISKEGEVLYYGEKLYPFRIHAEYHAIGSGSSVAFGALAMGATAKEAVKAACKFDVSTGLPVKTLSWKHLAKDK